MLKRAVLNGFKSIKHMDIELRGLNVLIGANGVGKSNFVSFFKMLNEMMAERLQQYIGTSGRAQSILHFGPKVTPQMEAKLEFEVDNGRDIYEMRLFHAAGDTLVFAEENMSFFPSDYPYPKKVSLGAGHHETRVCGSASSGEALAKVLRRLLNQCRVYHFHDTSLTARVRQYCYIGDDRWLMPDAGNLAALLYRLRHENNGAAYHPIVRTIRLIAPFFADFDLEPTGPSRREIMLNWRETSSDQVFGPHQLSDGTLRAICLVTLLMQPAADLPDLIIVDEPELGLHPYALNVIASLFSRTSQHTQVIVSTQSSTFLSNFEVEDVIVTNRAGNESQFRRLDPNELEAWLEDYSLGEVWEKNIITGGGPH
ncbi:MAG: AAA family ATPase [Candidatus Electronema sp. V4]|uniref:AAA family ATPase n=1 Tax=Candidatus Electronema sp. V4 TaxID=3454756 RepID=UPI004055408D